ncbi:MAG: hypothetical protein RPV21_01990 [Candidatus Sedimenticola sp. (ex Thyasira tokunagai)]
MTNNIFYASSKYLVLRYVLTLSIAVFFTCYGFVDIKLVALVIAFIVAGNIRWFVYKVAIEEDRAIFYYFYKSYCVHLNKIKSAKKYQWRADLELLMNNGEKHYFIENTHIVLRI